MSSEPRKFTPNLSNCRTRKGSTDYRPRTDSSSSEEISLLGLKNHEFNFAPDLSPQKRIKPSQISNPGKNLDIHFPSHTVCEEVGMEDDDYIHLAKSIAEQHGGICLSETCESPAFPLLYKCKIGHIWEGNDVVLSGAWCWKCKNILDRAKEFASLYEGQCRSITCDLLLDFECKKGHHWKADITRFMHQKWCRQCSLDEKHERRCKLLQERQEEEAEQARTQERLFMEAREKMKCEAIVVESEQDVEIMADQMARRYLESSMMNDCIRTDQVSCVYQVICASQGFLRKKHFSINKDSATANFRKLARLLHPDKNKHPLASEAFLKISSSYAESMANA